MDIDYIVIRLMLLFYLLGALLLLYYFREQIRNFLPPNSIEFIGTVLFISLVLHLFKQILRNDSIALVEGFQDEISPEIISQAILEQTENLDKILDPTTDSLETALQQATDNTLIDSLSYSEQLRRTKSELTALKEEQKNYKAQVKNNVKTYIDKNYVSKDRVVAMVRNLKDNFKQYDVTKHPDFKKKCSKRENFPIQSHQDYMSVRGKQLDDYDVTKHSRFNEKCLTKCANPNFFNIKNHTDYNQIRGQDLKDYDVKKHPNFTTECLNLCKNKRFFNIRNHDDYEKVKGKSLDEYNVIQHKDFASECKLRCADQDFFKIRDHSRFSITQIPTNFKDYDISKHPDFKEKCANPDYFKINEHQSYVDPIDTNSQRFKDTCKNQCMLPGFIDISKHPEYVAAKPIYEFTADSLPDFRTTCADPDKFSIKEHKDYEGVKMRMDLLKDENKILAEKQDEIIALKNALMTERNTLKTQNKDLSKKAEDLTAKNLSLNRSLKTAVSAVQVNTTRDCPDLSSLLRTLK